MFGRDVGIEPQRKKMDTDTFLKDVHHAAGSIMLGRFKERKAVEEKVFYWKENDIYQYDFAEKEKCQVEPVAVRRHMAEILEVKGA